MVSNITFVRRSGAGLSLVQKAGIGIAVGGSVLVLLILCWCFIRKTKRNSDHVLEDWSESHESYLETPFAPQWQPYGPPSQAQLPNYEQPPSPFLIEGEAPFHQPFSFRLEEITPNSHGQDAIETPRPIVSVPVAESRHAAMLRRHNMPVSLVNLPPELTDTRETKSQDTSTQEFEQRAVEARVPEPKTINKPRDGRPASV